MKSSEGADFKTDLTFWIWWRFEVVIAKNKISKFQWPPFNVYQSKICKKNFSWETSTTEKFVPSVSDVSSLLVLSQKSKLRGKNLDIFFKIFNAFMTFTRPVKKKLSILKCKIYIELTTFFWTFLYVNAKSRVCRAAENSLLLLNFRTPDKVNLTLKGGRYLWPPINLEALKL